MSKHEVLERKYASYSGIEEGYVPNAKSGNRVTAGKSRGKQGKMRKKTMQVFWKTRSIR